jgi:hypothetical protein
MDYPQGERAITHHAGPERIVKVHGKSRYLLEKRYFYLTPEIREHSPNSQEFPWSYTK